MAVIFIFHFSQGFIPMQHVGQLSSTLTNYRLQFSLPLTTTDLSLLKFDLKSFQSNPIGTHDGQATGPLLMVGYNFLTKL